jgi:hypothetical protein
MQLPRPFDRRSTARSNGADRRAFPRYAIDLPANLSVNGKTAPCHLVDISASGALLRTDGRLGIGDRVSVDLPHCGPTIGTVVRLTPSHVAVSFRGLLLVSKLYEETLNA